MHVKHQLAVAVCPKGGAIMVTMLVNTCTVNELA